MKKIIIVIAIAILIFLIAGCSNQDIPDKESVDQTPTEAVLPESKEASIIEIENRESERIIAETLSCDKVKHQLGNGKTKEIIDGEIIRIDSMLSSGNGAITVKGFYKRPCKHVWSHDIGLVIDPPLAGNVGSFNLVDDKYKNKPMPTGELSGSFEATFQINDKKEHTITPILTCYYHIKILGESYIGKSTTISIP
ncbi:MAG TPA: hypothetical protein PLA41_01920 [Candidatus Pacearchaeota archaeon]|nr:hypothetical protein [Candidatus Pacearchaeota archaeon]HQI74681.1 hypothetical protein [Candidatus Pacearchaeota archaeon]